MQKLLLVLSIGILSANFCHSQDYYIVVNDTIYGKELRYSITAQGYLKKISYQKRDGTTVILKKKKELRSVISLYINDISIDKVPLKPSKPDGYVRFLTRSVDGIIKTYSNDTYRPTTNTKYTPGSPFGDFKEGGSKMGSYHYTIKMPDGTYFDIKKRKNLKNHIQPFLLKCQEFKKQYTGDFNTHEKSFNETIRLYNSLCQ